MIARHETQHEQPTDVWAKLAAPLPAGVTAWRQDGRPIVREGKFFARYVAYIDANTVRERLDSVVPGEWHLTLELLPPLSVANDEYVAEQNRCAFKARLQILGVVREDVGTGKDYKQAATDAFKRVAVRFGIGHELYEMGQNWVRMDGDGKYAKPIESPEAAYERRHAPAEGSATTDSSEPALRLSRPSVASDVPACPKCGGKMWDNRLGKRNPRAPDFKCRDRNCDGVIWPSKPVAKPAAAQPEESAQAAEGNEAPAAVGSDAIPF